MISPFHKLDNPAWYSLAESHQAFAVDYGEVKFYHPDYCPFGGVGSSGDHEKAIASYAELTENFFIVGGVPALPSRLSIQKELVCLQMILVNKPDVVMDSVIIKLNDAHQSQLFELVNLVQPGYFRAKTSTLGDYFGIFEGDQLIAVTGERMLMNEYTEVSAVVTHPEHVGKGFAKQLVAHGVENILAKGKTPYLHVVETNTGAIALYHKLGFETRRKISFWNVAVR
jgi:GNAT superfamily N-acetyltransferase